MKMNEYLSSRLLSGRATSKPAINLLGTSICDVLQNHCTKLALLKPVGTLGTGRSLAMHPWGGRSARSGSAEPVRGQRLRVGSVDGGIAIIEIPYLALTKDLPGVRDV
jgi:hypothetical protein